MNPGVGVGGLLVLALVWLVPIAVVSGGIVALLALLRIL